MTAPRRARIAAVGSAIALILFGTGAARAQVAPPDTAWSVLLPKESKVAWRGAVNFDGAGSGAGTMMYPAPSPAGLLIGVLVHAAIVNSTRDSDKAKLQAEADNVVLPYRESLVTLDQRALYRQALAASAAAGRARLVDGPDASAWSIESVPTFVLTQDQRALVLDNAVVVRAPGPAATVAFRNVIRVVSDVQPADDAATRWAADQAAALKGLAVGLLAVSLDMAVAEAQQPSSELDSAQRTIRYPEGGLERMERAQPLRSDCARVVARTLRGGLMSMPTRAGAEGGCGAKPAPAAAVMPPPPPASGASPVT